MARSCSRWRPAEQLAEPHGRFGMGMGRPHGPILLSRVPARTARSQLAQRRGTHLNGRRLAVLAGSRCRWLSCRCALVADQGRPLPRQSAEPAVQAGEPDHHRQLQTYTEDQPEVHDIVRSMRATLDEYGERVLIGEIYLPVPQLVSYYGPNGDGANMPFNFQLISAPWNATEIARIVSEYDHALPLHAWPNWVLGNHDNPRVASRIGARQARVAAMLLLTLRGTPTLYYGDEIAMADGVIPPDRVQDPAELRQPGIGQGRDPERTPMQWDGSPNAGFSSGVPWLPISGGDCVNVVAQDSQASSMLTFYRHLLALRRSEPALVEGAIERVASNEIGRASCRER